MQDKFPNNYFFSQYFRLVESKGLLDSTNLLIHRHHILPKSIFRKSTKTINLTPKDHGEYLGIKAFPELMNKRSTNQM